MLKYPSKLDIIFDKLKKYDIKPIIVGGYVRDYFLNLEDNKNSHSTKDIDIELYNADSYEKIEKIISEFGNPNIIGKSFGVIKLHFDDLDIDFSLPRLENKISKGHSGFEVNTFKELSFYEASSRRDFTINAIGYDIFNEKILDPHNGLKDLKDKKLKIVNKKTFVEDPLRVLRAMQFCARFELESDSELIKTCRQMCKDELLTELATQRIYEEFKKLFTKSKKPSIGLKFLKDAGAFLHFKELDMPSKRFNCVLSYIDNVNNTTSDHKTSITVMLAILCYKMDRSSRESFLNKITNEKNIIKDIDMLKHIDSYLNNEIDAIKYTIAKKIDIHMLIIYLNAQKIDSSIVNRFKMIRPLVNGKELLNIGMKKSKNFSEILQLVYEMQLKTIFKKTL